MIKTCAISIIFACAAVTALRFLYPFLFGEWDMDVDEIFKIALCLPFVYSMVEALPNLASNVLKLWWDRECSGTKKR